MDSSIWLTSDQIAHLRAALLRARDELKKQGKSPRSALRLRLVDSALTRLNNGTYGECVTCEEPVAFQALRDRPEAPFCAECERERRPVSRRRRTG